MRYLVLMLLVFVACSRKEAVVQATPVEASVTINTSSAEDAGPPLVTRVVSAAHFTGDRLFECLDLEITAPPDIDVSKAASFFDDLKKEKDGKGLVKIGASCPEAFADRTVLASCRLDLAKAQAKGSKDAGQLPHNGRSAYLTTSFYNYDDVFRDDQQMKDCLEDGNQWAAVSRNSPAFLKAKSEASRAHAEKALRGLQNLSE